MQIKELLKTIREQYAEAGIEQLEVWFGQLVMEYSWICEQLSEVDKNRALKEIEIKKTFEDKQIKVTETEVQRLYNATEEGKYKEYNKHYLKAIGQVLSFVRFRIKALKGEV